MSGGKNVISSLFDVFSRRYLYDNQQPKEKTEMIDQVKIGNFLRKLRKEKGMTQEEIATKFGVSSRSVSRWENGNTMPDLAILVELADYYDVDIREIIDGERKSENMEKETKETLLKIADYADKQKRQAVFRAVLFFVIEILCFGFTIAAVIFRSKENISAGFVVVPLFMTVVCSIALIINARGYVWNIQRK